MTWRVRVPYFRVEKILVRPSIIIVLVLSVTKSLWIFFEGIYPAFGHFQYILKIFILHYFSEMDEL